MKSLYAACLSRLGLSLAEAAALHGVGLSTVKHWTSGRRAPPQGVWDELRRYELEIVDAAEELREAWEQAGEPPIEIDTTDAGTLPLIAAADFVLGTAERTPVEVGPSEATGEARRVTFGRVS